MTTQLNVRLPDPTIDRINQLAKIYGSQAKVIIAAVENLHTKEIEMYAITIPQKMSGTGTIHDVESEHFDREIVLPAGAQYAVVLAAYYGGKGYTTHRTAEAAIKQSNREREYSHMIVDKNGAWYRCDGYELIPVANY